MEAGRQGRYVTCKVADESFRAFVPSPLPPQPPTLFNSELIGVLEEANRLLGRLDGLAAALPDPQLLLYQYVRKEAVLSSQIEGTQSSLSDLLIKEMEEIPGVPEYEIESKTKERRYVDGALPHTLRVPFGYWEAKGREGRPRCRDRDQVQSIQMAGKGQAALQRTSTLPRSC